jgi:hypothetical protein
MVQRDGEMRSTADPHLEVHPRGGKAYQNGAGAGEERVGPMRCGFKFERQTREEHLRFRRLGRFWPGCVLRRSGGTH